MSPQEHADRLHGIAHQFEAALRDAKRDGLHVDVSIRSHEVATIGANAHYFQSAHGLGVLVSLPLPPTRVNPELAMQAMNAGPPAAWTPELDSPSRR